MTEVEPNRTQERPPHLRRHAGQAVVPVFFISDSTGISAETLGNALLIQFPDVHFERKLFPFVSTLEEARRVVGVLDAAAEGPVTPLAFSTLASIELRDVLRRTTCPLIDFFDRHLPQVESVLGREAMHVAARLHGLGDVKRYNHRMSAIEYAIEHDDGQSLRALDKADVILLGPSRCGKTPTSMYLALQHGLFVANYPLVEDDFDSTDLPVPVRAYRRRCFGVVTTAERLSQVRQQRRPNSRYASPEQCAHELRLAEALMRAHHVPSTSSANKSVEEIATIIMQTIHHRSRQ
ncbi:MAG: kinase/pyrophosphorylase [Intrasporangium sp.]|uniref:pyruvate, water dikinase regulatory protein n=1 Tax=Intrasporangium sp. TaxID=1925024 RepID=UPI0026495C9A|nr:pyruvate, water dikinase regulatory protein [Intrasporangium sp.]MDN5796533.1 kinase/pyrophosphorylase [Intrasporangium sp.]